MHSILLLTVLLDDGLAERDKVGDNDGELAKDGLTGIELVDGTISSGETGSLGRSAVPGVSG